MCRNTVTVTFLILVSSVYVYCIPKIIIVSYDGFRYDYLNRNLSPNLNALKSVGSHSKFIINVFPTQTFTNHFTLGTGLYSEVHGVLASHVYDEKQKVLLNYSYSMFHYNEDIVPIWTLNQQAGSGRHSGVMMWPGGEFEYKNTSITFVEKYDTKIKWEERVNTVIGWIKHPKTPANLVMMYFEEPDLDSHIFGPDSKQTDSQIQRVDAITKYILDSLEKNNLKDVNLIFLSDHGMESVPKENIINLSSFVGDLCDMYGASPVLQIYAKPGKSEEVFEKLNQKASALKTFKVFKKKDIPEHLHYKNCERAPPILAVAEPKYAFQDLLKSIEWYKEKFNISGSGPFGVHGYDPKTITMHPFFIAKGPVFKPNYIAKSQIESIDLYLLFAHILHLKLPPLKPSGSISHVIDILKSDAQGVPALPLVLGASILAVIIVLISILFLYVKFMEKRLSSPRSNGKEYIDLKELTTLDNYKVESQELLLNVNQDSFYSEIT